MSSHPRSTLTDGGRHAVAGLTSPGDRLPWLDITKAAALAWIFLNHAAEQAFGYPLIGNPTFDWPPLATRVSQLAPLSGFGIGNIPVNLLRYLGWAGDCGVQIFLVTSGFGLTLAMLKRHGNAPFAIGLFMARRAERIYPLWWGSHLGFAALALLTGWKALVLDPEFYMSFMGVRITRGLFYYFSPAWWYFGLVAQLYLVYPVLWALLRRWGPTRLLWIGSGIGFAARGVGLLFLGTYMDVWLRGSVFLSRLPEFLVGVAAAAWMFESPRATDQRLRRPSSVFLAVAACGLGSALSLTGAGMVVAPALQAAGLFVLFYAALARVRESRWWVRPARWLGEHSYSMYLVHHPWILLVLPVGVAIGPEAAAGTLIAIGLTLASAIGLEAGVRWTSQRLLRWRQRTGWTGLAVRLSLVLMFAGGTLVLGELCVRRFDPQEVLGWGERASLAPDPVLGWRLRPLQRTHLRWDSYDYWVSANALGFPGPAYSHPASPGTLRILVVGDAFSSAEGVDTEMGWPRLLEKELSEALAQPVEVLNLSITGYGPQQYAEAVAGPGAVFGPQLILVATSTNDFQDALLTIPELQQSIGFEQPDPFGWRQILSLTHLRRWTRLNVYEPLRELLRGEPRQQGYFYGGFLALEVGHPEFEEEGRHEVALQLARIERTAKRIGARVVLLMAPSAVQVCEPGELAYYPRSVDLSDESLYDIDLPQRLMAGIAQDLGLPFLDLRGVLQAAEGCPYQPRNMHWVESGHAAVATFLREAIGSGSLLARTSR